MLIYAAASFVFFGRPLVGHFRDVSIGITDYSFFIWCLVWWPHAVTHHLNPFLTNVVWAPGPLNLTWSTGVALTSFLAWPLTAMFGPIAAFNVLCLMGPPLAAWTAFLLCRYVSGSFWPALLGGYVFGFSSFMLGHQFWGHTDLTMVFLVPLALYFVLLLYDGWITPRQLTIWLALLLSAQFMIAAEVFATMTVFGAMAIALYWSFTDHETRRRLARILIPIAAAYALSLCAIAPYLYYMFAFGHPAGPIWSPADSSADLLNFLIPTPVNELGLISYFVAVSRKFSANMIGEATAYLGIPLILVAAAFARRHWREPSGKLLIDLLVILSVLAMGPVLEFSGAPVAGLPGKAITFLPLLNKTLPGRFSMYIFLDLALIVSLWFATTTFGTAAKTVIAGAIVIFQLPNLSGAFWAKPIDTPKFFTDGLYAHYINRDDIVVVLPYGYRGNSMIWQAQSGMYFRMAGGSTGAVPAAFRAWPIFDALVDKVYLPDATAQLEAFMAAHDSTTLIIADNDPNRVQWDSLLSAARVAKVHVGGVSLYRFTDKQLEQHSSVTSSQLASQTALQVFGSLVDAAQTYLSRGGDPRALTPLQVGKMGLVPESWLTGHSAPLFPDVVASPSRTAADPDEPHFRAGVWLGVVRGDVVAVGLVGRYAALKAVIDKYGKFANNIYCPYPQDLLVTAKTPDPDRQTLLLMLFDRSRLAAAAKPS